MNSNQKKYRLVPWSLEDKLEIVRAHEQGLGITEIRSLYGVSKDTFYRWIRVHKDQGVAGLEQLSSKHLAAKPLSAKVEAATHLVKEIVAQEPRAGIGKIQGLLYRQGFLKLAKETVRTLLRRKGLSPSTSVHRSATNKPPQLKFFERAKPNDLWQTDIMSFMLKGQYRVYLIGFMDDNSRFLVGWGLYRMQTTANVLEVFRGAIEKHGLPKEVLSDNGRQYYTWRGKSQFTVTLTKLGIRHIRSRPYHPQTLGKIESFWRNLFQECLAHTPLSSFEEAVDKIGRYIEHYNFKRPHQGIANLTPSDRFYGVGEQVKNVIEGNTAKVERCGPLQGNYHPPAYIVGNLGGKELRVIAKEADVLLSERKPRELVESGLKYAKEGEPKNDATSPDNKTAQPNAETGVNPSRDSQAAVAENPLPAGGGLESVILPMDEESPGSSALSARSRVPGAQAREENQKSTLESCPTPTQDPTVEPTTDNLKKTQQELDSDGGVSQANDPQECLETNTQGGS